MIGLNIGGGMKKIMIFVIAAVLSVVIVIAVAKDPITKMAVEKGTRSVTGLELRIRKMAVGIMSTLVSIEDLRLLNPPGYKDRVMLDMPEIYVDYNLPALIAGKVHLNKLRLNMSEFVVVKNEKGEINLNALNVVKEQKGEKKVTPAEKAKMPDMQIDVLELKVGKVVYKDYSMGGLPRVQEFNINLDERYLNVDDPDKLVSLIVVKAISNTSIARLTGFDLKGLENTIGDTLGTAQLIVDRAQDVITTGGETARKTVEGLQDIIKMPFGTKETQDE
jgi:hypothetical protein